MSFNKLADKVAETMEWIDRIDNVNRGGCGVVAMALHDALTAVGIPVTLAHVQKDYGIDDPEEYVSGWRDNEMYFGYCYHIMVVVNDPMHGEVFIDSTGLYYGISELFDLTYQLPDAYYDVRKLRDEVSDLHAWNDCFDHGQRPRIRGKMLNLRNWAVRNV